MHQSIKSLKNKLTAWLKLELRFVAIMNLCLCLALASETATYRAGLSPRGPHVKFLGGPFLSFPFSHPVSPAFFLRFFISYNNTFFRSELEINYLFEEINCCCIVLHTASSF